MNTFILLTIGLILLFLEFFVPGAVFGILGGIAIVASIVIFATETTSAIALFAFITLVLILLYYLIKFTLWRIRNTKSKQSLYSDADQTGFIASTYDSTTFGKKGVVLSDLKPGGYILINNKKYQALSTTGYLPKGTEVEVIDGQEDSLIVKPTNQDKAI